jgi:purine catabolism regulator
MQRALVIWIGLLSAGALACAGPVNSDLERAEAEYRAAAADAYVADYAPTQLREAEAALARAQRAFRADADPEVVDHLAYLATRRVEIARATARRNEAFARVDAPPRQRLHRGDAARGGDLLDVLGAMLAHPGNRTAAAQASHLSRSVFYQRLALIGDLLDADLDDGETLTALHLALLVRRGGGVR